MSRSDIMSNVKDPIKDIRHWLRLRFFAENINEGKILIIGDHTGAEFEYFRKVFPNAEIDSLDLLKNKHVNIVVDIQKFKPRKKYDAVIMNNVLEHLEHDFLVLRNIRKMLSEKGRLCIAVPLQNDDNADFHVQLYNTKIFDRTLEVCGFKKVDYMEYGVFFGYWYYFLKRWFRFMNEWIYRNYRNFRLFNKGKYRGCNYICEKSDECYDYLKVNKSTFSNLIKNKSNAYRSNLRSKPERK